MLEYSGTVKKWIDHLGYGFVTLDDGRDVYVHGHKLREGVDVLARGEAVWLDMQERPDGKLRATRIELQ